MASLAVNVDPSATYENELIQQCLRERDLEERRQLLSELFRRYYVRVREWCVRFTGDRESAADLTQEIFLRAHKYFESFKGDAAFATWLYVIARNYCKDHAHSCATRPELAPTGSALEIPDDRSECVQQRIEREARFRMINALLESTLDETEVRVFLLHYADDESLPAITKRLKLRNASGAKAYIVSAKRKLSSAIQTNRHRTAATISMLRRA